MRRMWAAVAAIVMCLAPGVGPATAQDESPLASPSASVAPAPGTTVPVVFSGRSSGQLLEVSDPRVSGSWTVTEDHELDIPEGSVGTSTGGWLYWGTFTLHGPDGDWIGPWLLMAGWDLPSAVRIVATVDGTGAYEGLAALVWMTHPGGWDGQEPAMVEGVIYEGSAPRMEWPAPEPSPASG